MARSATPKGDIKVTPEPHEKAVFIAAAEQARQSLTQWMIQAGLERAERQGLKPKRQADPGATHGKGGKR